MVPPTMLKTAFPCPNYIEHILGLGLCWQNFDFGKILILMKRTTY